MTTPQMLILGLIAITFFSFIWGKWRYDVVAFSALIIAVLLDLVPASKAFVGFGHPATITVAAVLILSRALTNAGATDLITRYLLPFTHNTMTHIGMLTLLALILSAFMNNVGALALLMPVAIESAIRANRSPAILLMPLSFGSILGGLITQIGTPPNIIIANYRAEKLTGVAFSMFDFTPVGGIVALVGGAFITIIGWRLIPKPQKDQTPVQDLFDIERYVTEAQIIADSKIIDKTLVQVEEITKTTNVGIIGLIRDGRKYLTVPQKETLQINDILIIEADPKELDQFVSQLNLRIVGVNGKPSGFFTASDAGLAEVVVTPRSEIDGRTVQETQFSRRFGVNLLAVSRQGHPFRGRLRTFRFRVGDVILLHGIAERLSEIINVLRLLPLAERGLQFGRRQAVSKSIWIFVGVIMLAAFGVLEVPIALTLGAGLMVLANFVPLKSVYDTIDWPVIILLGAMIPIGEAFESTGTAELVVKSVIGSQPIQPIIILSLLMVMTMAITDILNNAATAIIMAPIAVNIAKQLDVNPDTFLMGVAIASSCAFLTPIGHQNNALIMGPGGYKFGDFWRMGLPLDIILLAVAIPTLAFFWPL